MKTKTHAGFNHWETGVYDEATAKFRCLTRDEEARPTSQIGNPIEKGRTQEMRRPCIIAPESGGLLFGAQFTYLTHAPQRALTGFLRLKSEIADRVSGPAHHLESFARWRSAFKDSRFAMEQFSQVVTCDCLVHFIHISHLFPFSCFLIRDPGVTHTNCTSKKGKLNRGREHVKRSIGNIVHRSPRSTAKAGY